VHSVVAVVGQRHEDHTMPEPGVLAIRRKSETPPEAPQGEAIVLPRQLLNRLRKMIG